MDSFRIATDDGRDFTVIEVGSTVDASTMQDQTARIEGLGELWLEDYSSRVTDRGNGVYEIIQLGVRGKRVD